MAKKGRKSSFRDEFYVKIYQLRLEGLSEGDIAKMLGVGIGTFRAWKLRNPAVLDALKQAKTKSKARIGDSFKEYVFNRLPEKLQRLWTRIDKCDTDPHGIRRMEELFSKHGENARKHLFLYALTTCQFNPSRACKKVGISVSTMKRWISTDPDFSELVDEIQFHKKNFIESKLMELVKEKDTNAVLFANRTLNRDRGFGDKTEIEIKGRIDHTHSHTIRVDQLDLDFDTSRKILEAINAKEISKNDITIEPKQLTNGSNGSNGNIKHSVGNTKISIPTNQEK